MNDKKKVLDDLAEFLVANEEKICFRTLIDWINEYKKK